MPIFLPLQQQKKRLHTLFKDKIEANFAGQDEQRPLLFLTLNPPEIDPNEPDPGQDPREETMKCHILTSLTKTMMEIKQAKKKIILTCQVKIIIIKNEKIKMDTESGG